jgi:hypothetical protein
MGPFIATGPFVSIDSDIMGPFISKLLAALAIGLSWAHS